MINSPTNSNTCAPAPRPKRGPELLSPAGDPERLEMALAYGADAVYLAGPAFGLRAGAGNFSGDTLRQARALTRQYGAALHVTVNAIPHDGDLQALPAWLEELQDIQVDALIVADLGVLSLCKRYAPHIPIHASTQMGIVNAPAATMLADLGAQRVVLARELSLEEITSLRAHTPASLALEAFVHGAMCVSFSGRCLLSNYLTGRDGNRGACAQPCRWSYKLVEETRPGFYMDIQETEGQGTHILNARDLCMVEHIDDLIQAGIDSLKIEGRMKSAYYTAVTTGAYRGAIDDTLAGRPFDPVWRAECDKVSHRPYDTGFYYGMPGQYTPEAMYYADAEICAVVESCDAQGEAVLTERNRFGNGDAVELVIPGARPVAFTVENLRDENNIPLALARHAMMPLRLQLPCVVPRLSILRRLK